jgi:hypothetical protein
MGTIMPNSFAALVLALVLSSPPAMAEPAKTSKERLSDKAADEQRVDNCGVPPERRGPMPRPDCPPPALQPTPYPPRQPERPGK